MKYTITLKQNFPFAQNGPFTEIEGEKIICNDVNLPGHIECTYNPYNVRLLVIGHQFGAVCAIFAACDQDALDAAVDAGQMDFCLAEEQDYDNEELTPLGNASELFDLSTVWIAPVEFDAARDIKLIVALARAAESGADTLE
jgi:hypothetical protein